MKQVKKKKKKYGSVDQMKKENKTWENKRKDRYNATVWKGWRTSGASSKVTVYKKSDLDEMER